MKKILILLVIVAAVFILNSCTDYAYQFHFYVNGENGVIMIDPSNSLENKTHLCNENNISCEFNCPKNSNYIKFIGGKTDSKEVTFKAVPLEGYEVNEWSFNGKIIDNNTDTFTALVNSENNYVGIISVSFKEIHQEHSYVFYRDDTSHNKIYYCGCELKEELKQHSDLDNNDYCDECKYHINSNNKEMGLINKTIFVGNYSNDKELFLDLLKELNVFNNSYSIIENEDIYKQLILKLTALNKTSTFADYDVDFKNNVVVFHRRNISGSILYVPVNYYYNIEQHTIIKEYANDISGDSVDQVFVGYSLDIIVIPKLFYDKACGN